MTVEVDLRLSFPLLADDLPHIEKIVSGLYVVGKVHDRRRQTTLVSTTIISQYPMVVEVDGETWISVDPTSYDRAMLIINMRAAKLPDEILERLPSRDTHISAAQFAIGTNRWSVEMKRF